MEMGWGLSEPHLGMEVGELREMKPLISMATDGEGVESPREQRVVKLSIMLESC